MGTQRGVDTKEMRQINSRGHRKEGTQKMDTERRGHRGNNRGHRGHREVRTERGRGDTEEDKERRKEDTERRGDREERRQRPQIPLTRNPAEFYLRMRCR